MANDGDDFAQQYRNMRVPELRKLCSEKSIESEGVKSDLVARLAKLDRDAVLTALTLPVGAALDASAQGGRRSPVICTEIPTPSVAEDLGRALTGASSASSSKLLPPTVSGLTLTEDEKALRGLLQFFICADARRPSSESAPLQMRYRDLVNVVYELQERQEYEAACEQSLLSEAMVAAGTVRSPEFAGAAETGEANPCSVGFEPIATMEIAPAPPDFVGEQASALIIDDDDSVAESLPAGSLLDSREHLKRQLLDKQKQLARDLKRLRKEKLDQQVASRPPPAPPMPAQKIQGPPGDFESPVLKGFEAEVDGSVADLPMPPPAMTDTASVESSQSTRRLAPQSEPSISLQGEQVATPLRATGNDQVVALVECERLKARKAKLEEVRTSLRDELARVKEQRLQAAMVVNERRNEEADAVDILQQSLGLDPGLTSEPPVLDSLGVHVAVSVA